MIVGKIGFNQKTTSFKGEQKTNYENPVSRSTERNLAVLSTAGMSAFMGLTGFLFATTLSKSPQEVPKFLERNKRAMWIGAAVAAVTAAITLPMKLYNTKVNVYVKEKEMDVFSRDRSLKTNLTEEVDKEVRNPEVSLDKKLDDNLKLQMANRGAAIGIANMSSK